MSKNVILSAKNIEVKFKVRNRVLTAIRNVSLDFEEGKGLPDHVHNGYASIFIYEGKVQISFESGEKFETNLSIQELSEKLGRSFFQCHKSCIVNVEKIKRINYSENTITFLNNKTVYLLSNRKKKELKTYVANY